MRRTPSTKKLRCLVATERKMPLENHSIKATQAGYNVGPKLGDENRSWLAWRSAPRVSVKKHPSEPRTPCLSKACGCGDSRVKSDPPLAAPGGLVLDHPLAS